MSTLLEKAMAFAIEKHVGQKRKSWNVPYVLHTMEVTYQLSKLGISDESTLCGAVLHDTLEDTSTTFEELVNGFNPTIATIVFDLTCMENQDKVLYIESFGESDRTRIESLVIKLMDRTCNIKDCIAAGKMKWAKNMFAKGKSLWDYLDLRGCGIELDSVYDSKTANIICEYFEKQRKKFEKL